MIFRNLILSFSFFIFSLWYSTAYGLIREVDFSKQNIKYILNESTNDLSAINLEDKFFVLNEESSGSNEDSISYDIMVFPADGSNPFKGKFNTEKSTPLANRISLASKSSIKTLRVPENESAFIFVEQGGDSFNSGTKKLYHEDEIVTLGEIQTVKLDDGSIEAYHRVLVRENSQFGQTYYGLVPFDQVREEKYTNSMAQPVYDWEANDMIHFNKKNESLYYEEDGKPHKMTLAKGVEFQFIEEVDGGKKGNIVILKKGRRVNSNNPLDYEVIHSDIILSERVIPYNNISKTSMKGVISNDNQKLNSDMINKMEDIKKEIAVLVRPAAHCFGNVQKILPMKKAKTKNTLATQLLCALRKKTGIRNRSISNVYIEKLAPSFERLLNSPYGPTSEVEKLHFLAQLMHETGGFSTMIERRPTSCWNKVESLIRNGQDAQMCKQFSTCANEDNKYFLSPKNNSKGIALNYTHKDKFRGRFPIQLTHCYNYLGFFQHLSLLSKGKTAEAMKYSTNFSGSKNGKAKSYCSDSELKDLVLTNKSTNLDPLNVLLSPNPTQALNELASPCEQTQKNGMSSTDVMAQSALWYWKTNPNCKNIVGTLTMNSSSVIGPTKCINGGTNGLNERKSYFNALKSCMGK